MIIWNLIIAGLLVFWIITMKMGLERSLRTFLHLMHDLIYPGFVGAAFLLLLTPANPVNGLQFLLGVFMIVLFIASYAALRKDYARILKNWDSRMALKYAFVDLVESLAMYLCFRFLGFFPEIPAVLSGFYVTVMVLSIVWCAAYWDRGWTMMALRVCLIAMAITGLLQKHEIATRGLWTVLLLFLIHKTWKRDVDDRRIA